MNWRHPHIIKVQTSQTRGEHGGGNAEPHPPHGEGLGEDIDASTYRGEEHGEGVDSSFQNIPAPNGQDHGRQKHEVAQAEQECGQQLEAVGERIRAVGAAPAPPPCGREGTGWGQEASRAGGL